MRFYLKPDINRLTNTWRVFSVIYSRSGVDYAMCCCRVPEGINILFGFAIEIGPGRATWHTAVHRAIPAQLRLAEIEISGARTIKLKKEQLPEGQNQDCVWSLVSSAHSEPSTWNLLSKRNANFVQTFFFSVPNNLNPLPPEHRLRLGFMQGLCDREDATRPQDGMWYFHAFRNCAGLM
jgi:hypothetical protein